MNGWEVALLAAAGYVAVMALVRLMIRQRDQLLAQFRQEMKVAQREREAQIEKERHEESRRRYREAA